MLQAIDALSRYGAARAEMLDSITVDGTVPVPEPQSWALLLAGVGLAGGAVRQDRRRRLAATAA